MPKRAVREVQGSYDQRDAVMFFEDGTEPAPEVPADAPVPRFLAELRAGTARWANEG